MKKAVVDVDHFFYLVDVEHPAFFNLPFSNWSTSTCFFHFSNWSTCLFLTGRRRPAFFKLVDLPFSNWSTLTCLFQPAFFELVDVDLPFSFLKLVNLPFSNWSTVDAVDVHFTAFFITPPKYLSKFPHSHF